MKEPKYVKQTLAWCNSIRKSKGKKPLRKLPKGIRRDGFSCPCGTATAAFVSCENVWLEIVKGRPGKSKAIPAYVKEFVKAFDAGKLPQYIA